MLRERNIAVFIDVDNCDLSIGHYENVISQVTAMGEIVEGKVYGVSEKKNREIINDAQERGFELSFPIRNKKRGAKLFDNRIAIDVVETVTTSDLIDTVAIVSASSDLVHLFRLLKKYDVKIAANENADEASMNFIDEVIDLGKVERIKLPQQQKVAPAKKPPVQKVEKKQQEKPVEQPKPVRQAEPAKQSENKKAEEDAKIAAELMKEIEELRKQNQEAEQKLRDSSAEKAKSDSIANEAQDLLKQIDQIRNQKAEKEQPVVHTPVAKPQPQKSQENENDLIKRIEALRNSNDGDDTNELIAKLQSLFDEE